MSTCRGIGLILVAWIGWGCAEVLDPGWSDGSVAIQTDRSSYQATYIGGEGVYRQFGFVLVARYTNRTKRTVYLGRCSPDSEQPLYGVRGVDFESAYNAVWACVGHDRHFRVEPGESRTDTLHIKGPTGWSAEVPYGKLEGVFELAYFVGWCPGECQEETPEEAGMSNRFEVEVR